MHITAAVAVAGAISLSTYLLSNGSFKQVTDRLHALKILPAAICGMVFGHISVSQSEYISSHICTVFTMSFKSSRHIMSLM